MAGRDYTGTARGEFIAKAGRAYCEGCYARTQTTVKANPYSAPNLEEQIAWDAGWVYVTSHGGNSMKGYKLNCALPDTIVPTP